MALNEGENFVCQLCVVKVMHYRASLSFAVLVILRFVFISMLLRVKVYPGKKQHYSNNAEPEDWAVECNGNTNSHHGGQEDEPNPGHRPMELTKGADESSIVGFFFVWH